MKYIVSSTGLYSTWLYSQEFCTLFDCGEGVASALQNKVFAVERICISHGHMDHIGGIPNFLWARVGARGDKTKPLTIHYPESPAFLAMRAYAETFIPRLGYEVTWAPVTPDARIPLAGGRHYVRPFRAPHGDEVALGYQVLQDRLRLKPEYSSDPEIGRKLAGLTPPDKLQYQETVALGLLAFSGDSMPIEPRVVAGCQSLFFDSTFLREEDRKAPVHASLPEAFALARQAKVRQLYAYHISPRYESADIEAAERQYQAMEPPFQFSIIRPNAVHEIE